MGEEPAWDDQQTSSRTRPRSTRRGAITDATCWMSPIGCWAASARPRTSCSKAAIQVEPGGALAIDEIDIPDPGANQVTVRNFASGVCYSQLHQLRSPGLPRPMGLGHEGSGVVTQVGKDVTNVREGDHVISTWVPRTPIRGLPVSKPTGATLQGRVIVADGDVYLERAYGDIRGEGRPYVAVGPNRYQLPHWLRRVDRGRRGAAYGEDRAWPVGGCIRRWRRRFVGDRSRHYCWRSSHYHGRLRQP